MQRVIFNPQPIDSVTSTFSRPLKPVSYDCVRLVFIREGSAILRSQFGQKLVTVGDVTLLCANTLFGAEPEGSFTVTTVCLDTDYVIDQVFWRHPNLLTDRLHARELAKRLYTEPARFFHLGERQLDRITPWLDKLTNLTSECSYQESFNRIQALWFLIADVINPFIHVSQVFLSSSQRERLRCTTSGHQRLVPLRSDAMQAAELLRNDLAHHWTVKELAKQVHLSESQLSRVFSGAYGKTPMAYLTMQRVEELARLLRDTDLLVEDAIERVGWRSMSYAIRVFHRYVGVTPGVYRRTHNVVV